MRVLSAILLLALGCYAQVSVVASTTCDCDSLDAGESEIVYDSGDLISSINGPTTVGSCQDMSQADAVADGTGLELLQLITPPVVPYLVTRVCFRFRFYGYTPLDTFSARAVMFAEHTTKGGPDESAIFSADADVQASEDTSLWASVPVDGMVITNRRVYIGYRVEMPCSLFSLIFSAPQRSRQWFYRGVTGTYWVPGVANWDSSNMSVVSIRITGKPYNGAPPGWGCNASTYKDSVCDCKCGAWDPDCHSSVAGPLSASCSPGEVCDRRGECINPGWTAGACNLSNYGGGDGCQCGCGGQIDPDCRDETAAGVYYPIATNCPGMRGAKCDDSNQCVEAWGFCNGTYGDGFCDCTCQSNGGVRDIDCDITNHSDCGTSRHCMFGACRGFPEVWTCKISGYNAGDGCDCRCGSYDPDCDYQDGGNTLGCGAAGYSCTKNVTCVRVACGNGVVESRTENCDGGLGCSQCQCETGWKAYSPVLQLSCLENCGDTLVVGREQCDSGYFCNQSCMCKSGYTPYSPARGYCVGCGNKWVDADEQCDSGPGCNLATCKCLVGYLPTTPRSIGCQKIVCGNQVVQPGEQCDGGYFCQNCSCLSGYSPYDPPDVSCMGCGNGVVDSGEQCDAGPQCAVGTCKCVSGYVPTAPPSIGCRQSVPLCGNTFIDSGEECDGGLFCEAENCTCREGHPAYSPPELFCAGCGNGIVDAAIGELCDRGDGCVVDTCRCASGFEPTVPISVACRQMAQNATDAQQNLGVAVGVSVGVVVFVIALSAGVLLTVVFVRRNREAPNVPVEGAGVSFVATDGTSVDATRSVELSSHNRTAMASLSSFEAQFVKTQAPDGRSIYVVPVSMSRHGVNSGGSSAFASTIAAMGGPVDSLLATPQLQLPYLQDAYLYPPNTSPASRGPGSSSSSGHVLSPGQSVDLGTQPGTSVVAPINSIYTLKSAGDP